jgi:hypothetical protein
LPFVQQKKVSRKSPGEKERTALARPKTLADAIESRVGHGGLRRDLNPVRAGDRRGSGKTGNCYLIAHLGRYQNLSEERRKKLEPVDAGERRLTERSLKQRSQAEAFQRSAILLQIWRVIVERNMVPGGELQEVLKRGVAELGSTAEGSFVLAVKFEREKSSGLQGQIGGA